MTASVAQTVLDYLSVLVWPAVVLGLVLYFLIAYKENVRALIDAIRSLRGPGIAAELAPRDQPLPPAIDERGEVDEEQSELIELVAGAYEVQLAQAQQEHERQVEHLVNRLVRAQFELDFERQYQWIFGSQVRALRAMRDAGGQLPRAALEPIFEGVWAQLATGLTFDTWMSYLLHASYHSALVVHVNGTYQITPKGLAFLAYIERLRYAERAY
jgi:hypothetical protein